MSQQQTSTRTATTTATTLKYSRQKIIYKDAFDNYLEQTK